MKTSQAYVRKILQGSIETAFCGALAKYFSQVNRFFSVINRCIRSAALYLIKVRLQSIHASELLLKVRLHSSHASELLPKVRLHSSYASELLPKVRLHSFHASELLPIVRLHLQNANLYRKTLAFNDKKSANI